MTTPDLETYHIKRSLVRRHVEYIFIDHGMASYHLMYRKGPLDHLTPFSAMGQATSGRSASGKTLCPQNLVRRASPARSMLREVEAGRDQTSQDILIAPSWQKTTSWNPAWRNSQALLATGYRIVVRPIRNLSNAFRPRSGPSRTATQACRTTGLSNRFLSSETVYTADLVITD